jgi:hypothetical protein
LNIIIEAIKKDINKRLHGEGNKTKGNKIQTNNYLYKYNLALSPSEP